MNEPLNGSATPAQTATSATPATPATGAAPASGANNGAQNTGFRFTADEGVEDWMVGKTPREVANIAKQLREQLQASNQQVPQQQYQQQNYQQQPPAPTAPTQDDWMSRPEEAGRKLADFIRNETFAPAAAQFGQSMGETARALTELKEPDAFKRWGPEIDMEIARYQPDPRTRTPQSLKMLVDMVRARHVEELVEERVQSKLRTMESTGSIRADGSAGAASGTAATPKLDFNTLPPMYAERLQRHRVTEGTLREFFGQSSMRASFTGNPDSTLQECVDAWLAKARTGDLLTEALF